MPRKPPSRRLERHKPTSHALLNKEVLILDEQATQVFFDAILHPPKPNAKALAAVRRWKREIG